MGQEQYHSGLLRQDGEPDAGYHDAVEAAADLDRLAAATDDDKADAATGDVALLHDYDNLWALDKEPNTPEFDYWQHLETYYAALRRRSVTVDVVSPTTPLADYEAVVAPTLYLTDDERAETLESYVDGGGELLLTMRSGVKDPYNKLHDAPQPGPLRSLVGATVDQHESVPESLANTVDYAGRQFDSHVWNEWLVSDDDTDVLGRYDDGPADGTAAVVRSERGTGSTTYVGTWPKPAFADALVGDLLDRTGVETTDPLPDHVRFTRRGDLTWVANFGGEALTVDAPADVTWELGGETVGACDVSVTDAAPSALSIREESR